ncbi:MAG TPA: ChbG/HpnK family deacetylase [Methylomirabilota bacterium]|nr:ChbG/HpnK family deacetylase [Methylomirabilota bacterium]
MLRRLIVNADDFGMTPGVSAGILLAHRHGIVTSTTVLVTADVDRDQLAAALDSGLGLGIHLNLTLGKPLTRAPSLVDGDGRFVRDARRAAAGAEAKEVEDEIEAQLERFVALTRRTPTHLDTHHHVGLYAPVDGILLSAARRLGVAVRSQTDLVRARARTASLKTPDHFFGEAGPEAYWSAARLRQVLRTLPAGVSEFMTHPGQCDGPLAASRYGRQRETELVGLGSPEAWAAVATLGIQLCHFGDL